jgi:murein DD-endopeptidase
MLMTTRRFLLLVAGVTASSCHPVQVPADSGSTGGVAISRPADGGIGADGGAGTASVTSGPLGAEIPGSGLRQVKVSINGALESSLTEKLASDVALPLTQVVARILVWWVDLRRGLNKGDELSVVYSLPPGKEPMIHALSWTSSQGKGKHVAYLFQAPGAPFARYYDAEGKEVELRLVDGPIDTYDQVTSLLRDGRRHKGVDFRTPTGTPVKLPFDGTLVRKNWAFRANGNCLEFNDPASGRDAIFLHLSPLPSELKPGQHFKKGEVVAKSDNSGHSTAPHLHYQLMSPAGKVLDPFDIHKTWRAELPSAAKASFDLEVKRLNEQLEAK